MHVCSLLGCLWQRFNKWWKAVAYPGFSEGVNSILPPSHFPSTHFPSLFSFIPFFISHIFPLFPVVWDNCNSCWQWALCTRGRESTPAVSCQSKEMTGPLTKSRKQRMVIDYIWWIHQGYYSYTCWIVIFAFTKQNFTTVTSFFFVLAVRRPPSASCTDRCLPTEIWQI